MADTIEQTAAKIDAATRAQIIRDLDGLLFGLHVLYDIGKALPHPYDAIGDQANRLLHDGASRFGQIKRLLEAP